MPRKESVRNAGAGLNQALSMILGALQQNRQREQFQSAYAKASQSPFEAIQSQEIGVGPKPQGYPFSSGGVGNAMSVSPGEGLDQLKKPSPLNALMKMMTENPEMVNTEQFKSMYPILRDAAPQFQAIPAGATYGTRTGGEFTPEGVAPKASTQSSTIPGFNAMTPEAKAREYNRRNPSASLTAEDFAQQDKVDQSPNLIEKSVKGKQVQFHRFYDPNDRTRKKFVDIEIGPVHQDPEKLTSATRTMLEQAPKVKGFIARIRPLIEAEANGIGPLKGRWRDFMAGKIGAPDERYVELKTNLGLMSTLLLRMHVGARGGQVIFQHFKDMLDVSKDSAKNLNAALNAIDAYADDLNSYSQTHTDEGGLSGEDQDALDWAKENPQDPRAKEILKRLGQ